MKTRGIVLLYLLLTASAMTMGQAVTPVPKLDLTQITGKWFEIQRYPDKAEKNCASDSFLLVALADKANQIQLVTSCKLKKGYNNIRNGTGKLIDKNGDGRLKVSFHWPFSTKYMVMAVGPKYEWALVGTSNHKSLWIFSRTLDMAPDVLSVVEQKAQSEGFSLPKLQTVVQNPEVHRQGKVY